MKLVLEHLGVHAFEISVALLPHRQQSLQLEPVVLSAIVHFKKTIVGLATYLQRPRQLPLFFLVRI
jgi:hypothetical protein